MEDFLSLAHERYSCRSFSDKPVEDEKIDALLEAAIAAPSAVNKQPWHAWVIKDPQLVARIPECTKFSFGAKVFVLIGSNKDEAWNRRFDGMNFADVDASIAATHIMLEAHDLGLGTTWVGYFDAPAMKKLIPETEPYNLVALFPLGYPADDATPAARHSERKGVDEMVDWL